MESQEDVRRSADLMHNPNKWPRWPILPLVRRTGELPEVAILYDAGGRRLLFEGVNMFAPPSGLHIDDGIQLRPEEVCERGWRVE